MHRSGARIIMPLEVALMSRAGWVVGGKEGDQVRAAFDPKTGDVVRVEVTPGADGAKK